MTLPRYRSGPASLGRFTYREAHHAAALEGVGPEPGPALYALRLELAQFPLEVLLRGVADAPDALSLFQSDRIHPNEKAQPILLDNVWQELRKLLQT